MISTSQENKQVIRTSELIAPVFHPIWDDIKNCRYSEIDLQGGRYSTKSSFTSLAIVLGMMLDRRNGEITHGVALRKTGKDLRESVFEQIGWAIDKLHVNHLWKRSLSPMKWIYMPNSKKPQEIRFRGCDDAGKTKSIKFAYGYPKYLWFEEADQFKNQTEIRSVKVSIARKNDIDEETSDDDTDFIVFKTYNPPNDLSHWINIDTKLKKPYRKIHKSSYLDIPDKWLTKAIKEEIEFVKEYDERAYRHDFLGEITGASGLCYPQFDINKHVVNIDEFKFYKFERVERVICGCDGGTIIDNTTLSPLMLTTAGRIVCLPTFCYDPQAFGHIPLAASKQVKLMECWLDYWFNWLSEEHKETITPDMVTIVVDSAAPDLVLEFNSITKYGAIKVPKKDILVDMKRHQGVLTVPNYFTLINAGYIDPVSMRVVDDYDKYIEEVSALVIDETTKKPMDLNNHTIDGINYGFYIATQII